MGVGENEKDSKEHSHEISMYYLMKVPEDIKNIMCNSLTEAGVEEQLVWLPIDKLNDYTVFPRFFATEILNIPTSLKNIVDIQNR
ncbi:MAG: hypothetical protein ACRCXT_03765 [Paraclostridium sp.]